MKSLFDDKTHSEVIARINYLDATTKGQWGKMQVAQMLRHCQYPLKVALGKYSMKKPNPFMKLLFKSFKKNMYNDKPWKQNLPTVPGFQVINERDFSAEKEKLVSLVNDFHQEKDKKEREPHPAFGYFTYEQWGQTQYKHLDHHLRQFGV